MLTCKYVNELILQRWPRRLVKETLRGGFCVPRNNLEELFKVQLYIGQEANDLT